MNDRSERGKASEGLVITRVFAAPRAVVFKAWTDPEHVAKWWGPTGFTVPVCEMDARPGGAIRVHMRGPDGVVYPNAGVFEEVVPPERLVMTTRLLDDHGSTRIEVRHTITFAESGGRTTLTLRARVLKATPGAAAAIAGMREGWDQTLDKLAEHLEQERMAQ